VTEEPRPKPTAEVAASVDADLRQSQQRLRRLVTALIVAASLISGAVVYQFVDRTADVRRTVASSCAFYHDIAIVPVVATSSIEGVKIVLDARRAYEGLCDGPTLPPPGPLLKKLANQYGLPVPH